MRWLPVTFLVLGLAAEPGCDDGDGDGDADTDVDADVDADADTDADDADVEVDPPYVPAESYCERTVEAFCDFYVRCGRMAAADAAACREPFLESCNGRYERRYAALEAAGLLRLSAAGIEACAAHLAGVGCDEQLRDLAGPCQTMWEGTQPAGGDCGLDVESFVCSPGTECVLDLTLCGTCEPLLPTDASCPVDGSTCGAAALCFEGTCQPRPRVGESCGGDQECELGASCVGGTCAPRTTIVGLAEACDATRRCPYGARCADGTCQPTAGLGGACAIDDDCTAGWCGDGGTCVELLEAGAACARSTQCATGACQDDACSGPPSACFD